MPIQHQQNNNPDIMNGKAKEAWEIYLRMDSGLETLTLLRLIANDAFKVKAYYYSAKAFDVLERLDPDDENWQGKRAACLVLCCLPFSAAATPLGWVVAHAHVNIRKHAHMDARIHACTRT